jgi:hypothetical protein
LFFIYENDFVARLRGKWGRIGSAFWVSPSLKLTGGDLDAVSGAYEMVDLRNDGHNKG